MKLLNKFLAHSDRQDIAKSKLHGLQHANYYPGQLPFQAYLRVRPLFLPESMRNPQLSIEVLDRESVIFKHEHSQGLKSLTKDKLYRCTRTLPPSGKTTQLFQVGILDLVNDAFLGLNQALFVIGGKDAGKTHTFVGNVADPGLCFLVARSIFQAKESTFPNSKIYISFLSFGNGFSDLLSYTGEPLEQRYTYKGCFLPGLTQVECPDMLTYLTLLKIGLVVDSQRDTNRDFSHTFTLFNAHPEKAIFIIKFTIVSVTQPTSDNPNEIPLPRENSADLYLVDTESYESHDKINVKGVNNAMLAFNNCVRALYEINIGIREDCHVPYEQSPFTSFFKDYLGGHSKTFIIGTVSPYSGHLEYSMRTVREVQWAHKSYSTETRHSEPQGSSKALAAEVGYLKALHNDSFLISQEVSQFLKRKDLMEEEEKLKYLAFLAKIFKKCYYAHKICNEKQRQVLESLETIEQLQQSILKLEKGVMDEQIRSVDVKEFFLIKIVPIMFNLVYSKIQKLQQQLLRKLLQLDKDCGVVSQIRKDYREWIDKELRQNPAIKPQHQEVMVSFGKTLLEHANWYQYNFFKSFNHPNRQVLNLHKLKVDKAHDQVFKRIFKILSVSDEEINQFHDRAFAYTGVTFQNQQLALLPIKEKPRKSFKVTLNNGKLEGFSDFAASKRIVSQEHESQSIESILEYDQEIKINTPIENNRSSITKRKSENISKKSKTSQNTLSSIFDLPSTSMLLKMHGKTKVRNYSRNALRQSMSDCSDQEDEEDSDSNEEGQTGHNPNNTSCSGRYYDDEDPSLLYSNPRNIKRRNNHENLPKKPENTIRLHPPQLQIRANRAEIVINRKILPSSQSASEQTNNNAHNHMSNVNYSNCNQAINEEYNFKTNERNRQDHYSPQKLVSKVISNSLDAALKEPYGLLRDKSTSRNIQPNHNEIQKSNRDISTYIEEASRKQSFQNRDALLELINKPNIRNSQILENNSNTQIQNTKLNMSSLAEDQHQNRSSSYHTEQRQSLQPIFFQDFKLASQFNKKIVINVNLFKQDLESYNPPQSISSIFNRKHLPQQEILNNSQSHSQLSLKQKHLLGNNTQNLIQQEYHPTFENPELYSNNSSILRIKKSQNQLSQQKLLEVKQFLSDQLQGRSKKSLCSNGIEALMDLDSVNNSFTSSALNQSYSDNCPQQLRSNQLFLKQRQQMGNKILNKLMKNSSREQLERLKRDVINVNQEKEVEDTIPENVNNNNSYNINTNEGEQRAVKNNADISFPS